MTNRRLGTSLSIEKLLERCALESTVEEIGHARHKAADLRRSDLWGPVKALALNRRIRERLFRMDECTNISGFATVAARESAAPESADDDLVRGVLSGNEAAFAVLFERHRRLVTRLAYRFFYRREQVEDIVQESFASAYFALSAYRGGHERSFTAWLSRITVRACYDALQRSRRTESVMSELNEDEQALFAQRLRDSGGSDVESKAISRDLAAKLLQRLEPDDRLVLTLLSVADLSVAETAALTGWSVPKVKMRAHRARKALRRVLSRFV